MIRIHVRHIKERKVFDVQVDPSQSMDAVKAAVEAQSGLEQSVQHLVFKGKPLRSGWPLAEQGVEDGATVHLVLRLKTGIKLNVRVMSGNTIDIELAPKAPARELLATVSALLNLDERPRVVCFEGVRLAGSYKQYVLRDFKGLLRTRSLLARGRALLGPQTPEVVARLFGGRADPTASRRATRRRRPLPQRPAGVPDPAFWLVMEYWRLGNWRRP